MPFSAHAMRTFALYGLNSPDQSSMAFLRSLHSSGKATSSRFGDNYRRRNELTAMKDAAGYEATGANDSAIALFERAQHEMRCYVGDPIATARAAIEAAPEMVMPHVLKAWVYVFGTEPA